MSQRRVAFELSLDELTAAVRRELEDSLAVVVGAAADHDHGVVRFTVATSWARHQVAEGCESPLVGAVSPVVTLDASASYYGWDAVTATAD